MITLNNIDTTLFKKDTSNNFIDNLSKTTCSTLSNMLSMDYATRLNFKPEAKMHIASCVTKLKSYLGKQVITDDSFSVALTLFAVAIAPEVLDRPDKNNIIEQSQDAVIENIINTNFQGEDISAEERGKIKEFFKNLFKEKNITDILNYIQDNTKLFCSTAMYAVKKYTSQGEINLYLKQEINKILILSTEFSKKTNFITQATGKIASAVCALGIGALSVLTAGAAFAVVVIPASILAIKYAPELGEKFGKFILSKDNKVKLEEEKIHELKETMLNQNQEFLVKAKQKNRSRQTSFSPTIININTGELAQNKKNELKR